MYMIKLIKKGQYKLVATLDHKRMLYLDGQGYQWAYAEHIGDLFAFSKHLHTQNYVLAVGEYRIYRVKNEPKLVDLDHLELEIGNGQWQGYLLLTGLPTARKIRSRVEATREVISHRTS